MNDAASRAAALERAMRFLMEPVLKRYAEEWEVTPEEIRLHERELKRYLYLCAVNPGVIMGMTGQVDELWHTFILFTQLYTRFCEEVAGRYLHHHPAVPGIEYDHANFRTDYERFFHSYEAEFGERPDDDVWPSVEDAGLNAS